MEKIIDLDNQKHIDWLHDLVIDYFPGYYTVEEREIISNNMQCFALYAKDAMVFWHSGQLVGFVFVSRFREEEENTGKLVFYIKFTKKSMQMGYGDFCNIYSHPFHEKNGKEHGRNKNEEIIRDYIRVYSVI